MGWGRRIALWAAIVLATPALTLALLVVWLHTGSGRRWLADRIEMAASDSLEGRLTIGSLEGRLWESVELREIELIDARDERLSSVARLRVEYALIPLLSGEVVLQRIELDQPEVRFGTTDAGRALWEGLVPKSDAPAEPSTWRVSLGALSLQGGTIAKIGPSPATIEEVSVEVTNLGAGTESQSVEQLRVRGRWKQRDWSFDLRTALDVSSRRVRARGLRAELEGVTATGDADVSFASDASELSAVIDAPRDALVKLGAPDALLVPVRVELTARRDSDAVPVRIDVAASAGPTSVAGSVAVDPGPLSVAGELEVSHLQGAQLYRGAPDTDLELIVALEGTPAAMTARVTGQGRVMKLQLGHVAANIALAEQILDLDWDISADQASVSGGARVDLGERALRLEQATFKVRVDELATLLGGAGAGRLKLTGRVRGHADEWSGEADVDASGLSYGPWSIRTLAGRLRASAAGSWPTVSATLEGRDAGHGSTRWSVVKIAAQTARGEPRTHVSMAASGDKAPTVRLAGDVAKTQSGVEVTIDAGSVEMGALSAEITRATVQIGAGGQLAIAGLEIVSSVGRLEAEGELASGLRVQIHGVELERVHQLFAELQLPPAGTIDVSGTCVLRPDRFTVAADVGIASLRLREQGPALGGKVTLSLDGSGARVTGVLRDERGGEVSTSVEVAPPDRPAEVAAWGVGTESRLRRTQINIRDVELGTWWHDSFGPPWAGRVDVTAHLSDARRIDVQAALRQIQAPETEPWDATLEAVGELGAGLEVAARLDHPDAERAELEARVALPDTVADLGDIDLTALEELTLRVDAVQLAAHLERALGQSGWTGQSSLRARWTATEALRVHVDVRAQPPKAEALVLGLDATMGDVHTELRLEGSSEGRRWLAGTGEWGAGYRVLLTDAKEATQRMVGAELEVTRLPIGHLLGWSSRPLPAEVRGLLSGHVVVEGTPAEPTAELRLQTEAFGLGTVVLPELTVQAEGSARAAEAEITMRQAGGGRLRIGAAFAEKGESPVRVTLVARDLDLAPLARVSRHFDARVPEMAGIVGGDFELAGSLERLEPTGRLRWTDGTLALSGVEELSGLNVAIEAQPGWVTLRGDAKGANGGVEGDLRVVLEGGLPTRLVGNIDIERLAFSAVGTVVVDGQLRFDGSRREGLLTTRLDIMQAVVRLPEQITNRALHGTAPLEDVVIRGREVEAAEPTADSRVPPTLARILVTAPGTITVRHPLGEILLEMDLDVTLGTSQPVVVGTVRSQRGWVEIRELRYQVTSARASFDGRVPADPDLAIRLSRDFGDIVVNIGVSGRMSAPQLTLDSTPPGTPPPDLLARVLGTAGAKQKGDLTQAALGVVSDLMFAPLRRMAKSILPIDVLRVDTKQTTTGLMAGVVVGRWLTDDVFVAYRYRPASDPVENVNEATIEYQLSRQWSVESTYGDRGRGGIDLLWVKRF